MNDIIPKQGLKPWYSQDLGFHKETVQDSGLADPGKRDSLKLGTGCRVLI